MVLHLLHAETIWEPESFQCRAPVETLPWLGHELPSDSGWQPGLQTRAVINAPVGPGLALSQVPSSCVIWGKLLTALILI